MKLSDRHTIAIEAIREAGSRIKGDFFNCKDKKKMLRIRGENISTSTDIASEEIIIKHILRHFPHDSIISEERDAIEKKGDYLWVIDPLDGTSNFFRNIPYIGLCLSIQFQENTQFACIFDPLTQDLAFAIKGEGAFLNGKKYSVPLPETTDALTSFYIQGYGTEKASEVEIYRVLIHHCRRVLNTWAPSIDWLHLLQGNADFILNYRTESEDFAPGAFIFEEAGGRVESWEQEPIALNLRKHRRVTAVAAHPDDIQKVRDIISGINI